MISPSHWLDVFTAAGFALPVALAAARGKAATRRKLHHREHRDREGAERRDFVMPGRGHSLPFSDAVLVGDTLYLAGRIGFDPATGKPAARAEDEARFVMDGIRSVVEHAAMSMADLVYVQVFCPDVSNFEVFNGVYREYFKNELPARAFLGSGPLLFGARFEVQGIAVRRRKKTKRKG
jgi:2-iminobutanoate/2-iminopropanoate deaminase